MLKQKEITHFKVRYMQKEYVDDFFIFISTQVCLFTMKLYQKEKGGVERVYFWMLIPPSHPSLAPSHTKKKCPRMSHKVNQRINFSSWAQHHCQWTVSISRLMMQWHYRDPCCIRASVMVIYWTPVKDFMTSFVPTSVGRGPVLSKTRRQVSGRPPSWTTRDISMYSSSIHIHPLPHLSGYGAVLHIHYINKGVFLENIISFDRHITTYLPMMI